ncbi:sensor histidine kinase [Amycolatopsis sp. NPDC059657]|uniref:sensor histidine kinase n=1 Tax=Amycolatopsis sp. NPDC059657 TaxID=3346899 RepID=UPI00367331A1
MRNVADRALAWMRGAADWRKWTVSGLLAAMLAVPVIVAVAAGVTLVRQSVSDRAEAQRVERLALLRQGVVSALAAVRAERAGSENAGAEANSAAAQLNSLLATVDDLGDPARKATSQLARLDEVRAVPDPDQRAAEYSVVTSSLLDLDAAVQRGTALPQLTDATAAAAESATYARNLLIALAAAALAAGAVITAVLRRLRTSVKTLRTAALDIADSKLPGILGEVREGHADGLERPKLPPVTGGELSGVAAAFDSVCGAAIDAAAEQARIRSGYSEVFVNMFRRGQTLMQRQLALIEKLERNENSTEQLTTLYQLDHLVTRMRRTTENVLVLSGTELVRRPAKPVPLAGVIQAAISEIEQYQRVEVLDPPAAKVGDAAANDLIRMLAELLDNATSFSAPETKVTVQGQVLRDGSLSIAVVDNGIGMTDQEVVDINARLTRLGSAELAKCRQVGLHVVGRLAGRHGLGIELLGGDRSSGVTAVVSVPADLVLDAERPGWADRRIAMRAAETRRAEAKPVRRLAVVGADPVRELVEHAHQDVPDELPVRVPNRQVGRAGADGKSPAERVASGWFSARNTAVKPREVSVAAELDGTPRPENWISAADEGWSVVETISQAKPFAYTEDGLPVRERGAHLMPGSAATREPAAKAGPDPSRARSRLSSFQLGLRKAKDHNRR